MKNLKIVCSMATAVCMVLMMNISCKKTKPGRFSFTESICWEDSLDLDGNKAYGKIETDFPVSGDTAFLSNTRKWMNKVMGGNYEGDLADGEKMAKFYGKQYMERNKMDFRKYRRSQSVPYKLDIRVRVAEDNDKFVTYTFYNHIYTGGIHGITQYGGATFLKADGHLLGWDMFADDYEMSDELRDAIKEALKNQFFGVETDEELMELLNLEKGTYIFPLPTAIPYLTKEGIHFDYQQYEITVYAMGEPNCVVQTEKLEGILKKETKELIKKE